MSKWCDTCHRNKTNDKWNSCDNTCPVFGKNFEELAEMIINLSKEKKEETQMKPIEIIFKSYDEEYKARFWRNNYSDNGNLYVGIITWDEEYKYWEPWGDLTVNLGVNCRPNEAFLDTNNCSHELIAVLLDKGYIKDTGLVRPSGWCVYPLVEFTE